MSNITVQLETPINRAEGPVTEVAIRKPTAGELRGTKLSDLLAADVAALITVLPRVTVPTLTRPEVEAMDPVDFAALGGEVVAFLLPASTVAAART